MMEEETPVALEIAQISAVLMGGETSFPGLSQCHGAGCLARNTNIVEMDGMILLVLQGNNNDGISGHLLINRDEDTKEKTDQE